MRIIFVYPDAINFFGGSSAESGGSHHFGIACLSAALKQAGHETALVHVLQPLDRQEFLSSVQRHMDGSGRELIAFTSTTNTFPYVQEWANWVKAALPNPTVCGWAHCTHAPEEAIKAEGLDAVAIGECDEALVEFCNRLDEGEWPTDVLNFWVKADGTVYRNPVRRLIDDLDRLPLPDWDLMSLGKLASARDGQAHFLFARGCPFSCTYCSNHALRELYRGLGKYSRLRSVDNALREIESVVRKHRWVQRLFIDDDILPLVKPWFNEFCERFPKEIGLPYTCHVRPNLVDEEMVDMLRVSGCHRVHTGFESGNDRIANEILGRGITSSQIEQACTLLHRAGIEVVSYNMVGVPDEGPREILDTVKLNARAATQHAVASIFFPYPGTRLYDLSRERGLLTTKMAPSYFSDTVLKSALITPQQVRMFSKHFGLFVSAYRILQRLPSFASKPAIVLLDKALSSRVAPFLVGPAMQAVRLFAYVPARWIYRSFLRGSQIGQRIKRRLVWV